MCEDVNEEQSGHGVRTAEIRGLTLAFAVCDPKFLAVRSILGLIALKVSRCGLDWKAE